MKRFTLIPFILLITSAFVLINGCKKDDDDDTVVAESNTAPTVSISTPSNSAVIIEGQGIIFTCEANDKEDAGISGESIVWTSDKDGNIGVGDSILVRSLSVNTHKIAVKVTDKGNLMATDTVLVTVNQNNVAITIGSPLLTQYYQGENVDFACTTVSADSIQISASHITWTSDKDGLIGSGLSFSKADLSVNNHQITVKAIDNNGNEFTQLFSLDILENTITVEILDPSDLTQFTEGNEINFVGAASLANGNEIPSEHIVWSSDVDGELGTGLNVATSALTVNPHTITLKVTDAFGNEATATITIDIIEDQTPLFETLLSRMTGHFSSEVHADTTVNQYIVDVRLHMAQIWDDRNVGENIYWIYVEQAYASSLNNPYRQRIYKVILGQDDSIYDEIYKFNGAASYVHGYENPDAFDALTEDDLIYKDGCNVYFEWNAGSQNFVGATQGLNCTAGIPGVAYITSDTEIAEDYLTSWDRGYSASGQWVMGPDWPYIFDKVEDYNFTSSK